MQQKYEEKDATHSAPKRAAATPNVPQPHPKSATTLLLTSPKELSAWFTQMTKEIGLKQCGIAMTIPRLKKRKNYMHS